MITLITSKNNEFNDFSITLHTITCRLVESYGSSLKVDEKTKYLGDIMKILITESKNILKIKYTSNGKKYYEKITAEKELDIDQNSYFTIVKYDTNYDTRRKIILYSMKMIFLSIFLMLLDNFCDIQNNNSFYYITYKFKCDSTSVINVDNITENHYIKKKTSEHFLNIFYLILSFILFSLIILIIGSFVFKK